MWVKKTEAEIQESVRKEKRSMWFWEILSWLFTSGGSSDASNTIVCLSCNTTTHYEGTLDCKCGAKCEYMTHVKWVDD